MQTGHPGCVLGGHLAIPQECTIISQAHCPAFYSSDTLRLFLPYSPQNPHYTAGIFFPWSSWETEIHVWDQPLSASVLFISLLSTY